MMRELGRQGGTAEGGGGYNFDKETQTDFIYLANGSERFSSKRVIHLY
jgi:hypothetical protein